MRISSHSGFKNTLRYYTLGQNHLNLRPKTEPVAVEADASDLFAYSMQYIQKLDAYRCI